MRRISKNMYVFSQKIVVMILIIISLMTINIRNAEAYQPQFSTAGFYEISNAGREVFSMNIAWRFQKGEVKGEPFSIGFDDSGWNVVSLPHGIEYLPAEASGGVNYQGVVWYRKHFTPDVSMKGKKIFLHFEAIMGKSKVYVNGVLIKEYFGGYLPVIADVSDALNWNSDNVIAVMADNSDDPTYPVGLKQSMLDFTYCGGIYRDCWLVAHNPIYITNSNYENEVAGGGVFVSYNNVSEKSAGVKIKTHVRNSTKSDLKATVYCELFQPDGQMITKFNQKIDLKGRSAIHSIKDIEVKLPQLWSPESPSLYTLDIYVKDAKGKIIDGMRQRIGIRSVEFKQKDGLWINGKPYGKIMGTNRHQEFAIVGNAMPNTLQWRDAKKLKDAGMDVIRTHYVIDPAFMDACDELGIFALVETPGWQFWNDDPIFGERVYSDIRNMIRIHRNHACLFFWEPILNETYYPKKFARRAIEECDKEYPYPYSIAACDHGSAGEEYYPLQLRPILDKLLPEKTYFVREWGDNVDDWSAQNSNSRVARDWGEVPMLVQSSHYEMWYDKVFGWPDQIVGGCFWHSFDHQRGGHPVPFYGGMMDGFRQPKTSYYFFMSQREPIKHNFIAESGPMIYIAHEMTPFSPTDVTVFSNCNEVRLTFLKEGKQFTLKKLTDKVLPSPSYVFENCFDYMECKKLFRGNKHADCYLLAEGIINGKVVATHKRIPSEKPDRLRIRVDDCGIETKADASDVVTIIAEIIDKKGTVKRLYNGLVNFSVEGEGKLLGNTQVPLSWGSAPVLLQSTTKAGKVRITASLEIEGALLPLSGELVLETVVNSQKEIFSLREAEQINKQIRTKSNSNRSKSELEKENESLRKQLYEIQLKQVEKQQTDFGVGIND